MPVSKQQALDYHNGPRPGKIEVTPTKPCRTQRDLSLAYTPGVAEPCLEIEKNPQDAFKYTGKGNLVAVLSNGTAVLDSRQISWNDLPDAVKRTKTHGRPTCDDSPWME